jgi:hypothetical protein
LSDLAAKGKSKNVHRPKTWKIFARYCAKMSKLTFHVGITGEKLMDTDLKFSLTTTIIVLGLIVAAGLTAVLH